MGFITTGGCLTMAAISVRYIVDDVGAAVEFYRDLLGFEVVMHPAPGFAALSKDGLRLLLNAPGAGGAGQAGGLPQPGGWNRFQLAVDDLPATIERLREKGARFRGELVHGNGGDQILVEDPAGNPVELFGPPA
jgi:catechol 2,3-dioxygenase-like lactoylglutathione lyase family enzyme